MSLTVEARIGRKHSLYLPKAVVEALSLKEGEKVRLKVIGKTIILEVIQDPIELAISGEKFATVKPDSVEAISLEEQAKHRGSSA